MSYHYLKGVCMTNLMMRTLHGFPVDAKVPSHFVGAPHGLREVTVGLASVSAQQVHVNKSKWKGNHI